MGYYSPHLSVTATQPMSKSPDNRIQEEAICYGNRLSSSVCLVPLRQTVQGDGDHGLHWSIQNLHILAGIFSLDILYLEGKSPLLMSNIQVNFGDSLPETNRSSAFWDMDSYLKRLLLFSPIYRDCSPALLQKSCFTPRLAPGLVWAGLPSFI